MIRVASQSLPGDPPAQRGLHWGRCSHKLGEKQSQCSVGAVLGSVFASRSVLRPALYPTRLVLQTASWRKETAQCFEVSCPLSLALQFSKAAFLLHIHRFYGQPFSTSYSWSWVSGTAPFPAPVPLGPEGNSFGLWLVPGHRNMPH